MYLVFNVFYFYSGVGRAHLPPPPLCYALGQLTNIFFMKPWLNNIIAQDLTEQILRF
jgi:hypothetical protein